MICTSCHSRDDPLHEGIGLLDVVSEQTKHTGISFLSFEVILICQFVPEYATLAINLSLLQNSHLKLDTLDRKEPILWAKNTHSLLKIRQIAPVQSR